MTGEAAKFNVFISWSKSPSEEIAGHLAAWLPLVFDHINPWVSTAGIKPGSRSYNEIASALSSARFGIIVTTQENQHSTWLNYEAGALSNLFGPDEQPRVMPLLVNFKTQGELQSPIKQFENCQLDASGILELCKALSGYMGLDWENAVKKRTEQFWPELKAAVELEIAKAPGKEVEHAPSSPEAVALDEVLATVRELKRRSDETHTPPYVRNPRRPFTQFVAESIDSIDPDAIYRAASSAPRGAMGQFMLSLLILKDRPDLARALEVSWTEREALSRALAREIRHEKIADDARHDEAIDARRGDIGDAGLDPDDPDVWENYGDDSDADGDPT